MPNPAATSAPTPPRPFDAPTPQRPLNYTCYRAPAAHLPLTLDGNPDKPFWVNAPWTTDFVDIEGAARPRPAHRTRAKLLWDDEYLYIAAFLDEPQIWATLTEHDSIVFHDNDFEVFLNPTADNHTYYEIEINALQTIFDLFLPKPYRDGGPADHGWHATGMKKAVYIDGTLNNPAVKSRGWGVELAIPFACLDRHTKSLAPCPPRDGDLWRLNFSRVQWDLDVVDGAFRKIPNRPEHNGVWSPQGIIDMHRPEMWGTLLFSRREKPLSPTAPIITSAADESQPARDLLHAVYYAQKQRGAATPPKPPAAALNELDIANLATLTSSRNLVGPCTIKVATKSGSPSGWEASQTIKTSKGLQTYTIRHDSLMTFASISKPAP